MELIDHIEVVTSEKTKSAVIWLHGFGADGHDFEAILPELHLPQDAEIKFIFPHAPFRSLTHGSDEKVRAWYDIVPDPAGQEGKGITGSSLEIRKFIEAEESRGIKSENIILAGFSQGGVIALHAGLRYEKRLGGILALSTYLDNYEAPETEMSDANLAIPVMLAHGKYDQVIPVSRGATTRENLLRLGLDVRWFDYHMDHEVCEQEIIDIRAFFLELL